MTTSGFDNVKKLISLVILDSSRLGAHLLADALKGDKFSISYSGSNPSEALQSAAGAHVALVIAATDQHCKDACSFARSLRSFSPPVPVVLVNEDASRETVIEAFRSGVRGIFSRVTSVNHLRRCIRAVHSGQVWASNKEIGYITDALVDSPSLRLVDARGTELLSKRESDVARCVTEGLTNREIADRLELSENTIKNYLFRIFDKLGISSRVELTLYATSNMARNGPPATDGRDLFPTGDSELLRSCEQAADHLATPAYLLAEMYREGRGTPRDPSTAYKWFLVAQAVATAIRDKSWSACTGLRAELTHDQRSEAEEAAGSWLRDHGFDSPGRSEGLMSPQSAA